MRWDFVKFCIEKFIAGNLLREFRVQNLLWPEGLRAVDQAYPVIEIPYPTVRIPWVGEALIQESVVSKFVHECLDIEARKKIPNDHTNHDGKDAAFIRPLPRFCISGSNESMPTVYIDIDAISGKTTLKTLLDDETDSKAKNWSSLFRGVYFKPIRSWNFLWSSFDNAKIPVKLLHGPWTEDKLYFLYALNEGRFKIDLEQHGNIAKKGWMEAITEDNYQAVELIGRVWSKTVHGNHRSILRPHTEHLRLAVIESGCRKKIVEYLLALAPAASVPSDIDWTDPALVGWAEKKKKQGDEKGQWLLDLLQKGSDEDRHIREIYVKYGIRL